MKSTRTKVIKNALKHIFVVLAIAAIHLAVLMLSVLAFFGDLDDPPTVAQRITMTLTEILGFPVLYLFYFLPELHATRLDSLMLAANSLLWATAIYCLIMWKRRKKTSLKQQLQPAMEPVGPPS